MKNRFLITTCFGLLSLTTMSFAIAQNIVQAPPQSFTFTCDGKNCYAKNLNNWGFGPRRKGVSSKIKIFYTATYCSTSNKNCYPRFGYSGAVYKKGNITGYYYSVSPNGDKVNMNSMLLLTPPVNIRITGENWGDCAKAKNPTGCSCTSSKPDMCIFTKSSQ